MPCHVLKCEKEEEVGEEDLPLLNTDNQLYDFTITICIKLASATDVSYVCGYFILPPLHAVVNTCRTREFIINVPIYNAFMPDNDGGPQFNNI